MSMSIDSMASMLNTTNTDATTNYNANALKKSLNGVSSDTSADELMQVCKDFYNMSQAEFIRQAITGAAIRPIITVSPVNDELLAAVGKLTAEYGRIGGNLNQIARTLNEWHSPYPQLAGEVRAAVSDLAALKFEVLQKVGDAVGNIQTYQL